MSQKPSKSAPKLKDIFNINIKTTTDIKIYF